jgi:hypothetical protein
MANETDPKTNGMRRAPGASALWWPVIALALEDVALLVILVAIPLTARHASSSWRAELAWVPWLLALGLIPCFAAATASSIYAAFFAKRGGSLRKPLTPSYIRSALLGSWAAVALGLLALLSIYQICW